MFSHRDKYQGCGGDENLMEHCPESKKDVEGGNEDGLELYSLLKFGGKNSSGSSEAVKEEVVEMSEDENSERSKILRENGGPDENLADSLDEEILANRLKSASDSDNVDFSSDDDSAPKRKKTANQKNKTNKARARKKSAAGKKTPGAARYLRTVQIQTGLEDEESLEVIDTREENAGDGAPVDRKKMKSRKCQTPREQSPAKKRFRIRPAVPSSCTLCDKVYKNGEILRQHMKSHHVTGTIECPSCKLTFASLRSLKYHEQRKHSNLEPVPCTFCGKKFLDKKYLRIHENIHSQTNHFVCQFCGRKFIMKTNLTVHISRHHTKKSNDFVCQICGKAFPFKLYLKKHFKTHTDYKPYQCTYCEAKFRENTLLRKHVNSIHLKLRPFLCQYCHKTFTRSLYLREHMESQHLGIQRKAECSRCGQTFQNRNRLRQHECLGTMEIVRME